MGMIFWYSGSAALGSRLESNLMLQGLPFYAPDTLWILDPVQQKGGARMRVRSIVAGATVMMVLAGGPAFATMRITSDPGGQIGPYLQNLSSLRNSGERVVIDGPCLSACTMILGVIPRDHLCVTPRARLGFHTAWRPDNAGRPGVSRDGTEL